MNDKILKKKTLNLKENHSNVPLDQISVNLENFYFWTKKHFRVDNYDKCKLRITYFK